MYLPSFNTCLELLKTYTPSEKQPKLALPTQPRTLTKAIHTEFMFIKLENKILEPLSSAIKPKV